VEELDTPLHVCEPVLAEAMPASYIQLERRVSEVTGPKNSALAGRMRAGHRET
jgi:hypothetical protein